MAPGAQGTPLKVRDFLSPHNARGRGWGIEVVVPRKFVAIDWKRSETAGPSTCVRSRRTSLRMTVSTYQVKRIAQVNELLHEKVHSLPGPPGQEKKRPVRPIGSLRSRMPVQGRPGTDVVPCTLKKFAQFLRDTPGGFNGIGGFFLSIPSESRPRDAFGRVRRAAYVPETPHGGAARTRARSMKRPKPTPRSRPNWILLLKDFAGRPTPLYFAKRDGLMETGRRQKSTSKREDLLHTGRAQDQQRPGPGTARQGGWASIALLPKLAPGSTGWPRLRYAPLLGMECIIYMGRTWTWRAQELNVLRNAAAGAPKCAACRRGSKDAEGRDQRKP